MPHPLPSIHRLVVCLMLTAIVAIPTASASPGDRIGQPLDDATLVDLKGKSVKILSLHDGKVLVIAYTGMGCPISGRYAPRLAEISKKFAEKGVKFVGVNANPKDKLDAIAKECGELGYPFPILHDNKQELTRQLDVQTSTEVIVVDASKTIRYRGMIDDQYALGEKRAQPKTRYLERAIEAALKQKNPHITRTAAQGCIITRIPAKADEKKAAKITYSSHIGKIVQDNCATCHRNGGVGPFALTSHDDVVNWSAMIHSVVSKDRMPPWNAHEEFDGIFKNERKLAKKDKEAILAWIKDGMPRGDATQDPPPTKWAKGWRIGKPDRVLSMKESFLVPKEGIVEYKHFAVPTDYKEDKWIVAMEAKPGAPEVVHHILAFIVDPKKARRGGDPSESAALTGEGFLCATVPGDTPSIFPKGTAKRLPAGATIMLQMHYTTNGKAQNDRSSIGLIFAKGKIEREVKTCVALNMRFSIPPNDDNHEVRCEYPVREDIELVSLFPHMHFRGKDWVFNLKMPDGAEKKILSVPKYDFNWQESYIYKTPLAVPSGAQIECIAHYDNSGKNFDNPDPTATVTWGDQTFEEMMVGYIDYLPVTKSESGIQVGQP